MCDVCGVHCCLCSRGWFGVGVVSCVVDGSRRSMFGARIFFVYRSGRYRGSPAHGFWITADAIYVR